MDHYLECFDCHWQHEEDKYYTSCPACDGFLEVILDSQLEDRQLRESLPSIFKYQDFMPFNYEKRFRKFEFICETPEFKDETLSELLDIELILKDETVLPTGTWKDKEGFISIYRLLKNRIDDLFVFSSGNTGTAIARSASLIKGPKIHLIIPRSSKSRIEDLNEFYDDKYVKVDFFNGSNDECICEANKRAKKMDILAEGGFSNYARREGIKLFALEHYIGQTVVATDIDWYAQPVAGGIGVYSFYKACTEMGVNCPRILGVQADVCAPMVNAWNEGAAELLDRHIPKEIIPSPYVKVLRTRNPGDAYRILKKIMREVNGWFNDVSGVEIAKALNMFYESSYFREKYYTSGILVGLEAATVLAGVKKAIASGMIARASKVLLCVSGAAKKNDVDVNWIERIT